MYIVHGLMARLEKAGRTPGFAALPEPRDSVFLSLFPSGFILGFGVVFFCGWLKSEMQFAEFGLQPDIYTVCTIFDFFLITVLKHFSILHVYGTLQNIPTMRIREEPQSRSNRHVQHGTRPGGEVAP